MKDTQKKIIIPVQSGTTIRKDGKAIRVSAEVDAALTELSNETGFTKARLANFLLKQALEMVEVIEVATEI